MRPLLALPLTLAALLAADAAAACRAPPEVTPIVETAPDSVDALLAEAGRLDRAAVASEAEGRASETTATTLTNRARLLRSRLSFADHGERRRIAALADALEEESRTVRAEAASHHAQARSARLRASELRERASRLTAKGRERWRRRPAQS